MDTELTLHGVKTATITKESADLGKWIELVIEDKSGVVLTVVMFSDDADMPIIKLGDSQ